MTRVPSVRWIGGGSPSTLGNVPSVVRCLLAIAFLKAHVSALGLGSTLRWIRRREARTPARASDPTAFLIACEYAVSMAAALYPGRALCLERSLALLYLARRAGIPVSYHHGVQPVPFAAHAWIEYEGRVINDTDEHVLTYRRLPQVCP